MISVRIRVLREEYCNHCNISRRSPRSTGVKLLEGVLDRDGVKPNVIIDYGCSTWRNSRYLAIKYGSFVIRVDALRETRPDVVAYPTHMPFRDFSADIVLLTHILMFMNSKDEWPKALGELARVSKGYVVLETYHVKNPKALSYGQQEILALISNNSLVMVKRSLRRDMENIVLKATTNQPS
jgi:tellurite methyltransferase